VLDHIAYDAYGNVTSQSNASYGDEFQYAGMKADAATGLYYDKARWYSSVMGRFVSQDPTGSDGGDCNTHVYCFN
jgi:RHS repeat-associated protein